jgi:hypothetical protein
MQKYRIKSYGIVRPVLAKRDSWDDDYWEDEKISEKGSEFCPEPSKDGNFCHHENEIVFKLIIHNICGNNNEIKICPPQITTSMGCLDDIKDGLAVSLTEIVKDLMSDCAGTIGKLTIPVYVININNVLTSGNKNEICVE